jgi:hypothetical protein
MPEIEENSEFQIEDLEKNIASNPDPTSYAQLADLYRTKGELDKALKICEIAVAEYPKNIPCLNSYARVLIEQKQLDKAEIILDNIICLGFEDVGILIMLGQLYIQRGDFNGLKEIAERLSTRHPNDIRAKKFIGFLMSAKVTPSQTQQKDQQKIAHQSPEPKWGSEMMKPVRQLETAKPDSLYVQEQSFNIIPMEDLLRLVSVIKGITGVKHAIIVDPGEKTLASKGCPPEISKTIGGMIRSLRKALQVAFGELEFGKWTKCVMEMEMINVHFICVESYWIAIVCDLQVSLGSLRMAVNSAISRILRPPAL